MAVREGSTPLPSTYSDKSIKRKKDMSNMSRNIETIHNARPVFEAGYRLCKKPNKTPEEIVAAKSFKKTLLMAFSAGLVALIASIIGVVVLFFAPTSDIKMAVERTGTVMDDGTVRYVQNEMKYISLEELGLSNKNLSKGDRVIIGFDSNGEKIVCAYPKEEVEKEEARAVILFVINFVVAIVYAVGVAIIGPKTYGKAFHQYYQNLQYKQSLTHKL